MRPPAVALLALVLAGATAGCLDVNVAQWWRDEGTIRIQLLPLGPQESDVEHFRNLTLTVWSVALGVATLDERTGTYYVLPQEYYFDPPLRIEFVSNATEGREIPLVEAPSNLRAVQRVVLRVSVNESQLASGRAIEGCFQGIPHDPPCVRVAREGTYVVTDPTFSPRAGRTAVFTVPMGVHFTPSNGEYYVRAEVGRLRTE